MDTGKDKSISDVIGIVLYILHATFTLGFFDLDKAKLKVESWLKQYKGYKGGERANCLSASGF